MYGSYNDVGFGFGNMMGWFGGGIMMLVFWVLVILLVVWVVREITGRHSGSNSGSNSNSRALDILKERYAKGEISKEEFEAKKKDVS